MNQSLRLSLLLFGAAAQGQGLPMEHLRVQEVLAVPRPQKKNWLVGVQDAIFLKDGSIVVSDRLDFKLKKFDSFGKLIKETGRRGEGKGEFRGPGHLATADSTIAVADYASSRIQFFSADLLYKSGFRSPGSIFDICFDPRGHLWAGQLSGRQGNNLIRFSSDGRVVQTIALRNATNDPFDSMFWFTIDNAGEIIIAFLAQNRIEIWDIEGTFRKEFSVSGLPLRSKRKVISTNLFRENIEVPEDNIFWDVGIDSKGRIFLLANEYTPNPDRDVYVVSKEGALVSVLKLPMRCMTLSMDSRDRILVTDIRKTAVRVFELKRMNEGEQ